MQNFACATVNHSNLSALQKQSLRWQPESPWPRNQEIPCYLILVLAISLGDLYQAARPLIDYEMLCGSHTTRRLGCLEMERSLLPDLALREFSWLVVLHRHTLDGASSIKLYTFLRNVEPDVIS